MNKNWLAGTAVAATVSLAAVGAFAHGGATGIVKERMDLMDSLGKNMKALTAIMRGKEEYSADKVRSFAKAIGSHGGEKMTKLFPEGSDHKPTEALPSVWKDWDRFEKIAGLLSDYAGALEKAAGNERPMAAAGSAGMMEGGSMMAGASMMENGGMMSGGNMMGSDMMSAGEQMGPTPERLAGMPPDAAFMALAGTCSSCHQDFRKEKK